MATPNYIQDPKKKKGIGNPNQVMQGAEGSAGTTTGDSTGTGANTPDRIGTAVRGVVAGLGINPDIQNVPVSDILKNTAQNIQQKGILGSFAEGAARSARELATQSTNLGKAYLEGGKRVLFGTGTGAPETPAVPTSPIATPTQVKPETPTSPIPTTPTISNTEAVTGDTRLGQTPQGQLDIIDRAGGTGTIQFADQRRLSQDQLDSLSKTIDKNADPAFQARLAQEAALSQSRYDDLNKNRELDALKRLNLEALKANNLAVVSRTGRAIKELQGLDLEREKIGAEEGLAANKLGFDVRKTATQQALDAGKQQDEMTSSFFKMLSDADKSGTSNPLTNYSAARSMFGDNIDRRVLHAALGNDVASSLLANRGNLEEQVPVLQKLGFPEQDAQYILNQINQ